MYNLRIRIFRAVDDLDSCRAFMDGHINVLRIYGITEITTANRDWFYNPASYVIIAEDIESKNIVGGIRVHLVGGNQALPIEDAVSELDNRIHDKIREHALKGTGELCGLWNAREVAGMGVSGLLMRAGVSVVNQLFLNSLFALCAPVTLPMVTKYGFLVEKSLGKDGTFYYPKSDLIATAVVINDVKSIQSADINELERIYDLRNNPQQIFLEPGPKGDIMVDYDLVIKSFMHELVL